MANRDDILNELREMSPELAARLNADENPYKVPAGYFEELPAAVMARIKAESAPKVVSIPFAKRISRYAVAAAVIGLIALGAWLFVKQPSTVNTNIAQKENSVGDVLQKVQNVSDSEIVNYIEGSTLSFTGDKITVLADIQEEAATLMLANVSDEELQQYLDQHNFKTLLN